MNAFGTNFRWIYETRLERFFGGFMKRVWYDFSVASGTIFRRTNEARLVRFFGGFMKRILYDFVVDLRNAFGTIFR